MDEIILIYFKCIDNMFSLLNTLLLIVSFLNRTEGTKTCATV